MPARRDDDDVEMLANALKSNSTVRQLQLQGNANVKDASIDSLAAIVGPGGERRASCTSRPGPCAVTLVNLDNTGVSDAAKGRLNRSLDLRHRQPVQTLIEQPGQVF